jgi:CRISPR-associated protein Csm4
MRPTSGFGTPLKGDTLFGHFCWQAAYDASLLNGGLPDWIDSYALKPFAVFSSAWPKFQHEKTLYAMKRPDLTIHYLFPPVDGESRKERMEHRKENMARKWMLVGGDLTLDLRSMEFVTEGRLAEMAMSGQRPTGGSHPLRTPSMKLIRDFTQSHNSINRHTMTTGDAPFAPFTEGCTFYFPGTNLVLFVLIDETATDAQRVHTALERIGNWGFGKDASTGRGRFEVDFPEELPLPSLSSANACFVLAPVVPEPGIFSKSFFSPFIRFGKHGDRFARSGNPFKNPVVMADEGAVLVPSNPDVFKKPYIGRAVHGTSLAEKNTVAQGYSIYLPLEIGDLT